MANKQLIDALLKLDVKNDNHWTSDGQPRLETLRMLAGNASLSRADVEAADPEFTRQKAMAKAEAEGVPPAAADTAAARDAAAPALTTKEEAKVTEAGLGLKADGTVSVPPVVIAATNVPAGTAAAIAADPQLNGAAVVNGTPNPTADSDNLAPGTGPTSDEVIDKTLRAQAALEELIEDAEDKVEHATKGVAHYNKELSVAQGVLDGLLAQRMQEAGPDHLVNQSAITQYLEGQKAKLQSRADAMGEGAPKGTGKSALDRQYENRKRAHPTL